MSVYIHKRLHEIFLGLRSGRDSSGIQIGSAYDEASPCSFFFCFCGFSLHGGAKGNNVALSYMLEVFLMKPYERFGVTGSSFKN